MVFFSRLAFSPLRNMSAEQLIRDLYRERFGHYSERQFLLLFGISVRFCEALLFLAASSGFALEAVHLLWTLFFLKIYPTEDVASSIWLCDHKTYEKHVLHTLLTLLEVLNTVRTRASTGIASAVSAACTALTTRFRLTGTTERLVL